MTDLVSRIISGERRALSQAITLVESTRTDHRASARALLRSLPAPTRPALRIGLSGTPGVGKSTFIESFGLMLIRSGLSVAVLAVDPSSARSGGSILGDKTRMEQLSRAPAAYIRPSPSRNTLGGVARRTRETIQLCEAAGFDIVLVETVGVGQSETMVADMTDIFLLLLAPAGGDELQGVKRGIMEIADMILINKADGDLRPAALRTMSDYAGALRLLRKRPQDPEGFPKAVPMSALKEEGLKEAWQDIQALNNWRASNGIVAERRREQSRHWFRKEFETGINERLQTDEDIAARLAALEASVATGDITAEDAAEQALSTLFSKHA